MLCYLFNGTTVTKLFKNKTHFMVYIKYQKMHFCFHVFHQINALRFQLTYMQTRTKPIFLTGFQITISERNHVQFESTG
jgi:hypothetical protein